MSSPEQYLKMSQDMREELGIFWIVSNNVQAVGYRYQEYISPPFPDRESAKAAHTILLKKYPSAKLGHFEAEWYWDKKEVEA